MRLQQYMVRINIRVLFVCAAPWWSQFNTDDDSKTNNTFPYWRISENPLFTFLPSPLPSLVYFVFLNWYAELRGEAELALQTWQKAIDTYALQDNSVLKLKMYNCIAILCERQGREGSGVTYINNSAQYSAPYVCFYFSFFIFHYWYPFIILPFTFNIIY